MSSFKTRCPSCGGLNRVPNERVAESATCGKCKSPLLDGAPIEGTLDNFSALLESSTPVVVDFLGSMVQSVRRLCSCFLGCRARTSRNGSFCKD